MKKMYEKLVSFEHIFRKLGGQYDLDPYWNHYLKSCKSKHLSFCQMREIWEKFIAKSVKDKTLKYIKFFYLHIPFCEHNKCSYCMHPSRIVNNLEEVDHYLEYLAELFDFYKTTFDKIIFGDIFIGGGSASLLSTKQIRKLLLNIFSNFSFENKHEKSFEFHPRDVTLEKLKLVKKFGFNRVSFGVQSMDEKVLRANERYNQKTSMVLNAVRLAHKVGFREISIHLIYGLGGDSPLNFLRSLEDVMKLRPEKITVYTLRPTNAYLKKYFGATNEDERIKYNDIFSKDVFSILPQMNKLSSKLGYENVAPLNALSFDWIFMRKDYKRPDDFDCRYSSKKPLFEAAPYSCFGAGFHARSHISNTILYKQNAGNFKFDPSAKAYEGIILSEGDEMKKFIISSLNIDFKVSLQEFKNTFHRPLLKVFENEIEVLLDFGKIVVDQDYLYFNPLNPKERVIYPLFFIYND